MPHQLIDGSVLVGEESLAVSICWLRWRRGNRGAVCHGTEAAVGAGLGVGEWLRPEFCMCSRELLNDFDETMYKMASRMFFA